MPETAIHNIYIGADHRGFDLKEQLKPWLTSQGYLVEDCGNLELDPGDDFPPISFLVGQAVVANEAESLGILICGSGAGIVVAANKVKGARATLCLNPDMAKAARHDDYINVICLSANFQTFSDSQAIIQAVLETAPEPEERYQRRVSEITMYEQQHS